MIDDDVVNCGYNFLDTRRTKKFRLRGGFWIGSF